MSLCSPWITPADLPQGRPPLDGGSWEDLCAAASEVLYALSGSRWAGDCGQVTAVLRPGDDGVAPCCGTGRGYLTHAFPWTPVVFEGDVYNLSCCTPARVRLPDTCARTVVRVLERGAERPPGAYRLDRNGWVTDLTGRGWWPCGQGIEFTYTAGCPPPPGGVEAARVLAVELGRARAGQPSQLPARVTSLVRQGVTIGVLDSFTYLDKGRTGLYAVDLWLTSVTHTARGAAVWSPDLPTAHR